MIIYLLTFPNGKQYVGQTVRMLGTRLAHHRQQAASGSRLAVHCAWRKYGEPSVSVLGKFSDMESLHSAERAFIAEYGTLSPGGYNVSLGGDTAPSKSPEVARKISAKAKGRLHSKETREKLAQISKARWEDETYRAKVMAGIAESFTPERRAHISECARIARTGQKVSEETRAKLKARIFTDEWRAKLSASAKARIREPRSKETCDKIADRMRATWCDPAMREKRSESISRALKAKYAAMTEQERGEFSQSRKRAWETRRTRKD